MEAQSARKLKENSKEEFIPKKSYSAYYKVIYYEDEKFILIIQTQECGFEIPPREIVRAFKLSDIPENVLNNLSDWDLDQIDYFFWDLERK